MVVVCLVLLSIVGVAYLQVARQDRIAVTAGVKNNISTIANATVAYIGEVLKSDLMQTDPSGNLTLLDATNDEPYDYPGTNTGVAYQVQGMTGSPLPDPAHGGQLDDTWLASSEPDFTTNQWPHITNLNGIFLRIPNTSGSDRWPVERSVNNLVSSDLWRRDTAVPYSGSSNATYLDYSDTNYEDTGADADGDGIKDSKWTWAPIRQMSGVRYVMAIRIIDNSAMINLNTASSQVTDSEIFTAITDKPSQIDQGVDAPRWIFPSELDLGNFMFQTPGITPSQFKSFLEYRFNDQVSSHTRLPWFANGLYPYFKTTNTRLDFWLTAARLWNNDNSANYISFPYISNELELRHANGLNNVDFNAIVEMAGLSDFVRREVAEATYTDVPGVSTIADFFNKEPRHQMTTISGAATYMPPLPGFVPAEKTFLRKLNINSLFTKPANSSAVVLDEELGELASLVKAVIDVGQADVATQFPLPADANINSNLAYAQQFAVSFADHFDQDNISTEFNGRYGMEAWPFITEFYTQAPAKVVMGTRIYADDEVFYGTIRPQTVGGTGYVLEITNPHTRPVSLRHIQLVFRYQQASDNAIITANLPAGLTLEDIALPALRAANRGDTWLWPGQRLVIYHDSDGGPTAGRLSGMDHVLTQVIKPDQFDQWVTSHAYHAGDVIRHDENTDGVEEIIECITDHTSNTTNKPTTAYNSLIGEYSYHLSHNYWRRKLIMIDGGQWPINESDLFESLTEKSNMSACLRPYEMTDGVITPAGWSYQTVPGSGHPMSRSYSPVKINDTIGQWTEGTTYTVGQLVYARNPDNTIDYKIFRCIDPVDAGLIDHDPINGTGKWELDDDENMYYYQESSIGSVDGIKACAYKEDGYLISNKRLLTMSSPIPFPDASRRFEPLFDRIGFPSKKLTTAAWSSSHHYDVDEAASFAICEAVYTHEHHLPSDGTLKLRASTSLYAAPYIEPTLNNQFNQLLVDDQGVTTIQWTVGKSFEIGDIVHMRREAVGLPVLDQFFICLRPHVSSSTISANKPGVSGGNWPTFWKEHWRGGNKLYVDSVAKLSHVLVAGPNATTTVGDILGTPGRTNVDELMLPMTAPLAVPMQIASPWNIPHAVALLDRLTIHHPDDDGLDNDGDTVVDNPEELLVPGTVNLNTVPVQLLKKILPVTNSYLRGQMADMIGTYRDTIKGIANPFQLSSLLRQFNEYSAPIDNATLNGIVIDFHNPDMLTNDGIANDREEAMLPTQWFTGVATTRSDIYTAYIQIRGYPAGDFRRGPVESRRMIVVYDRSNIIDESSTPRILAVYTYE